MEVSSVEMGFLTVELTFQVAEVILISIWP
jgi:hypothetical protein